MAFPLPLRGGTALRSGPPPGRPFFHRLRGAASLWALAGSTAALAAPAVPWSAMPAPLLPLRLPVADDAGARGWTLRAEAAEFSADDATPVRDLSGDWDRYSPRAGRNAALQSARLELAATHAGWELAATLRSDVVITGSRGAFDAVHAYKQRQDPADGSTLQADAQSLGAVWAGLRVARSWALVGAADGAQPPLQLTAALTPLSLRRVQRTRASGQVQFSSVSGYRFDAQTQQDDSQRLFGGYGQAGARGSGWTGDLGLLWQPSPALFANLSVVNLASRLRLGGVGSEQMQLSSATRGVDDRGYLDYKPLATGRDSAQDLRLSLPRQWSLLAGWAPEALGGRQLGARWEQVDGVALPALWASQPLGNGWAVQLDAVPRWQAWGLGLSGPHVSLLLRSSALQVSRARALGWQAALTLPF